MDFTDILLLVMVILEFYFHLCRRIYYNISAWSFANRALGEPYEEYSENTLISDKLQYAGIETFAKGGTAAPDQSTTAYPGTCDALA